jgi:hypothetical protein
MLIDSKYISDNDMKQINKNTRKDFTRDDIYAFEITLCDSELDADYEAISKDCLYKLKDLSLGSSGFLTSDIMARIFDTYIEKEFISRSNSILAEETYKLKAKAYVFKNAIAEEELNHILNHPEISVGFSVKRRVCSICGSSECSKHIKGQKYIDEAGFEQLCYNLLNDPTDFYEWSVVPKQQESELNDDKSKKNKVTTVKTKLMINGKLTDVELDENGGITIIKPEKKATGWDFSTRPYYITAAGVTGGKGLNCDGMDKIYQTANAFSSEELAESINRMQTLQRQIFRWQAENDKKVFGLNKNDKWEIYYDYRNNSMNYALSFNHSWGFMPYFSSRVKAKECAEIFEDELMWLFTEFKWRMDGDSNK